ncbi:signal recognition particle-docking protein FtsY [candidate division WOR-3 bacterium]|nr:signal recognition particle-docking protein FtsY [candidate division WOR-3 bacterium]
MNFWEKITKTASEKSASLTRSLKKIAGSRGKLSDEEISSLEEALITSDMGHELALELIKIAMSKDPDKIYESIRSELVKKLEVPAKTAPKAIPYVIMTVGVNGTGKTTSSAKLGKLLSDRGRKVIFAAADTYRAAGVLQLQIWAEKLGIDIVSGYEGGDSAAVVHDALEAAVSREKDVLIIDTAGRLHTKVNLMNELLKIDKVLKKKNPLYPNETLIVMDATTGQNAVSQAKIFSEFSSLTGIILTKYDGTSKGGCIFPIVEKMKIPVKYLGIGESEDDFEEFDPLKFAGALLK